MNVTQITLCLDDFQFLVETWTNGGGGGPISTKFIHSVSSTHQYKPKRYTYHRITVTEEGDQLGRCSLRWRFGTWVGPFYGLTFRGQRSGHGLRLREDLSFLPLVTTLVSSSSERLGQCSNPRLTPVRVCPVTGINREGIPVGRSGRRCVEDSVTVYRHGQLWCLLCKEWSRESGSKSLPWSLHLSDVVIFVLSWPRGRETYQIL